MPRIIDKAPEELQSIVRRGVVNRGPFANQQALSVAPRGMASVQPGWPLAQQMQATNVSQFENQYLSGAPGGAIGAEQFDQFRTGSQRIDQLTSPAAIRAARQHFAQHGNPQVNARVTAANQYAAARLPAAQQELDENAGTGVRRTHDERVALADKYRAERRLPSMEQEAAAKEAKRAEAMQKIAAMKQAGSKGKPAAMDVNARDFLEAKGEADLQNMQLAARVEQQQAKPPKEPSINELSGLVTWDTDKDGKPVYPKDDAGMIQKFKDARRRWDAIYGRNQAPQVPTDTTAFQSFASQNTGAVQVGAVGGSGIASQAKFRPPPQTPVGETTEWNAWIDEMIQAGYTTEQILAIRKEHGR